MRVPQDKRPVCLEGRLFAQAEKGDALYDEDLE
jgi:hypothetical protein